MRKAGIGSRGLLAGAVAVVAAVGGLGLAAVRASDSTTVGSGSSVAVSSAGGAAVGDVGPELTVRALDGQDVRLPAGRPAAVFFFASWCGSCISEAAALGELQREHGDQLAIVAVDVDPGATPEMIGDFLAAAGSPTYPVVHDTEGALRQAFDVASLDVTVITDAAGRVVYRDAVPSSAGQLREGFRRAGAQL